MTPINDLHINDFCKDTAKIWLYLYMRFPQKNALYVEDIAGADEPDEFGLHSPRFQACFSTMLWLTEAGYLYYQQPVNQEALEGACLTQKAFILLSSSENHVTTAQKNISDKTIPVTSTAPRIQHLKHTLKHGSSEQLKTLILDSLSLPSGIK
ncbi:MAG: hypothetical protein COA42_00090 [Alteromonadaceae bacterium]|nr:MAG: hypothetical protein COA42_00090 [Alteromonadaceae bacterium]